MKNYLHLSFLKLWLLLLSFTFHHIFTASSSSSQSQSGRLVTRLIHRDSILFSKKNLTISDRANFNSFLKGSAIDYNVIFGCAAKYHAGLPIANGVIGINANPVSFLSSVGSEFSYCIGSINDPHYKHNFLILGDGAILDGELTPIQIRGPGLFYVTL